LKKILRMNLKNIIFITCILMTYKSVSQQIDPYSLVIFSPFQYNPAYTGLDDKITIQGSFRDQWIKIPGNPSSRYFLVDAPIPALGSGIGLKIQEDQFGASRQVSLGLNWSFSRNLSKNSTLSIGLGIGNQRYSLNGGILRTPDGSYSSTSINHQDNLLPNGEIALSGISYDGGVYLKTNFFETGFSASNILPISLNQGDFGITLQPHYTFSSKAFIPITTQVIVQPGIIMRYVIGNLQLDSYVLGNIREKFTLGTGLRGFSPNTLDGLMTMAGIQIAENISFFYTYTIPLSTIRTATSGSHEVMVRYTINQKLGKGILPPIIYNPRNL
jgi:type IX secretion system PorP/SprF family membrane protein